VRYKGPVSGGGERRGVECSEIRWGTASSPVLILQEVRNPVWVSGGCRGSPLLTARNVRRIRQSHRWRRGWRRKKPLDARSHPWY
jgi:hypothetical protein